MIMTLPPRYYSRKTRTLEIFFGTDGATDGIPKRLRGIGNGQKYVRSIRMLVLFGIVVLR